MVHTTFQYGGAQGKRHRLRESMMWEDEPDYYAAENFLVYEPDIPCVGLPAPCCLLRPEADIPASASLLPAAL